MSSTAESLIGVNIVVSGVAVLTAEVVGTVLIVDVGVDDVTSNVVVAVAVLNLELSCEVGDVELCNKVLLLELLTIFPVEQSNKSKFLRQKSLFLLNRTFGIMEYCSTSIDSSWLSIVDR